MKQIAPEWLNRPAVQTIFDVFARNGHRLYAVGGCVRNAVLDEPVNDLDFATDAPPDLVQKIADGAGLKSIPTGIDHGTITVLVADQPFEITTFRNDVTTDGRRAVVSFSDNILDDAQRRDFTMNALYLDADGHVLDPVEGLPDALARRLRFIGSPDMRIKEDYLRILRFFRFWAWYGKSEDGIDPEGLAACAAHSDGLAKVSKERIGQELMKLLAAPDPAPAIGAMNQAGVLSQILPGANPIALAPFVHLENGPNDPTARLATLGDIDLSGLRLSKADRKRTDDLRNAAIGMMQPFALGYHFGETDAGIILSLRSALLEMPMQPSDTAMVTNGANSVFPIAAADLLDRFHGKDLGDALSSCLTQWLLSEGKATKTELLNISK